MAVIPILGGNHSLYLQNSHTKGKQTPGPELSSRLGSPPNAVQGAADDSNVEGVGAREGPASTPSSKRTLLRNSETTIRRAQATKHPQKPNHSIAGWWWWEVFATVLSIGIMVALVLFLFKVNNMPLQNWSLPIQPNSLISILTTVSKTAMMIPAASCISQLKWQHFSSQPRRLVDLQIFDEASRGPWGSFNLILRLSFRTKVLVATGFAILTILILGIDASAQQILSFPLQETPLKNASAEMGKADVYFSKGLVTAPNPNSNDSNLLRMNQNLANLLGSFINVATGSIFEPQFSCPDLATNCAWETFTTLGLCVDFRDVTNTTSGLCTAAGPTSDIHCNYTLQDTFNGAEVTYYIDATYALESSSPRNGSTIFQSGLKLYTPYQDRHFIAFGAMKTLGRAIATKTPTGDVIPSSDFFLAVFNWCAQTVSNLTATPSGINVAAAHVSSERLWFNPSPVPLNYPNDINNTFYYMWKSNSTGAVYKISQTVLQYMSTAMFSFLGHAVFDPGEPSVAEILMTPVTYAFLNRDLKSLITNFTDTVTNQIRSSSPGDNYNASTISGVALSTETYVHVRWPWIILPLAEALLSAVFLCITIVTTRRQPLIKGSVIAYLATSLRGGTNGELSEQFNRAPNEEELKKVAESIIVHLEVDETGKQTLRRLGIK